MLVPQEVRDGMARFNAIGDVVKIYRPARFVAWVTLALLLLTVLYALRISVDNWSYIGV
jgi:hypothetical protein